MSKFNEIISNISVFYLELNDIGRMVFFIAVMLFFVLLILTIIMIFQKSGNDKQLKLIYEDEKVLENPKKLSSIENIKIDETNEKTRDLKDIVDKLKSYEKKDHTDIYEDEQEKTAVISCEELMRIKEEIKKPEKKEVFSSVYTSSEQVKYKENNNEAFLNSLKEFRNNL